MTHPSLQPLGFLDHARHMYGIIHLEATKIAFRTQGAAALSDACRKLFCLSDAWCRLTRIHVCHDPWGQRLYYHRLHYVHRLTAAAKQELQNKQKKGRQVSSIFSLCENNETDALHHMHTHSLGIPAIYERLSSFPLQSAHSVTPVTLARLWQSRDLPPSSDCSILAARLPQW